MSFVIIDQIGQELTETFENRDEAFRVQTAMQNRNRRPYFVVVALASQIVGRK